MAEREGFEPPVGFPTTVFKTAAFSHSAISPSTSEPLFCKAISGYICKSPRVSRMMPYSYCDTLNGLKIKIKVFFQKGDFCTRRYIHSSLNARFLYRNQTYRSAQPGSPVVKSSARPPDYAQAAPIPDWYPLTEARPDSEIRRLPRPVKPRHY